MKFAVFLAQALLFQLVVGQHANFEELDPNDEMNEDEFEKYYNKLPPKDPEEYKRRARALKKNEEEVKEENEKFMKGETTWFEGINEFSDLPEDEFKKEKTGYIAEDLNIRYNAPDLNITEGRGLLKPTPDMVVHPDSELYFASVMLNRGNAPRSYSSVDYGFVTGVKDQETCGSCVAFSTAAALEVCFAKLLGKKTDVSEQNFLDCGYQQNSAGGCQGASVYSYGKTWVDKKLSLAHEAQYPYKNTVNQCRNVPKYRFGADIVENYHTFRGTEELMKELVYKHGAVVSSLASEGPFKQYRGGIFAGCTSKQRDHAITVVGYGEENGIPYWLIKNSWGTRAGDKGYWRVRRGVNMCGIGIDISVPICSKVAGPTDAPKKVKKACKDGSDQCPQYANYCNQSDIKKICKKTCGTCGGNTGGNTESTCKDKYNDCANYKNYCTSNANIQASCPATCGTCGGNTKPVSNCKDQSSQCSVYKNYCSYKQIYEYCEKTCGLC